MTTTVICPYCFRPAEYLSGRIVAARFPKRWNEFYWACLPCAANVRAHKSGAPMGVLANGPVRYARGEAHKAIDRLWQDPREAGYVIPTHADRASAQMKMRRRVYLWIADVCQMTEEQAHIGMMTHIPLLEAIRDMAREMDPATLRARYHALPVRSYRKVRKAA